MVLRGIGPDRPQKVPGNRNLDTGQHKAAFRPGERHLGYCFVHPEQDMGAVERLEDFRAPEAPELGPAEELEALGSPYALACYADVKGGAVRGRLQYNQWLAMRRGLHDFIEQNERLAVVGKARLDDLGRGRKGDQAEEGNLHQGDP